MPDRPQIYLARHGETEWSRSGQHTGLSDIPLTAHGVETARALGERLVKITFTQVFSSPLQRAAHTCELAGYADRAKTDPELVEWDYGDYEGITTREIHRERPAWDIFADGAPGGESVSDVSDRADRVIDRLVGLQGNILLFSHGHFLRLLAARWVELPATAGRRLLLQTPAVSVLGFDPDHDTRVIRLWNDLGQLC